MISFLRSGSGHLLPGIWINNLDRSRSISMRSDGDHQELGQHFCRVGGSRRFAQQKSGVAVP